MQRFLINIQDILQNRQCRSVLLTGAFAESLIQGQWLAVYWAGPRTAPSHYGVESGSTLAFPWQGAAAGRAGGGAAGRRRTLLLHSDATVESPGECDP